MNVEVYLGSPFGDVIGFMVVKFGFMGVSLRFFNPNNLILKIRGELSTDKDILNMVDLQTKQWTELMNRQRKEEWEMLKSHLGSQVTNLV